MVENLMLKLSVSMRVLSHEKAKRLARQGIRERLCVSTDLGIGILYLDCSKVFLLNK